MTRSIEITVATDGSTTVETHGYVGSSCREASRFLERALGKPTTEHLKPAFHTREPQHEREREQR